LYIKIAIYLFHSLLIDSSKVGQSHIVGKISACLFDVLALLLWLFQDLVLWLLHTRQVEAFCPRRN